MITVGAKHLLFKNEYIMQMMLTDAIITRINSVVGRGYYYEKGKFQSPKF